MEQVVALEHLALLCGASKVLPKDRDVTKQNNTKQKTPPAALLAV